MKNLTLIILLASCALFAQREKELPITIEAEDSISSVIDDGLSLAGIVIPDTSLIDGSTITFQEYVSGQWMDVYDEAGDQLSVTVGRGRSIKVPFIAYLNMKSRWRVLAATEQDSTVTFKVLLKP